MAEEGSIMKTAENSSNEHDRGVEPVTRRKFISVAALSSAALAPPAVSLDGDRTAEEMRAEEIKKEKIRRAILAGPSSVTAEATVAEMDRLET